jgi:hypothetical protein
MLIQYALLAMLIFFTVVAIFSVDTRPNHRPCGNSGGGKRRP